MKQSMGFKNFGLTVLMVSMCLASGSMAYCDETAELERKQALEDAEIQKIQNEGTSNRLTISEITPQTKNGVVCSFNIETTQAGNWMLETLYPKDAIPMKLRMAGTMDGAIVTGKGSQFAQAGDISLLNANSILRFSGKVTLKEVVFEGEKDDPFTFILLDNGLVYVTGKGKVTLSDEKSVTLPY